MLKYMAAAAALLITSQAEAQVWKLDSASSLLSFVSIKKGNVGEVHHFDNVSGSVGDDGTATIVIDTASAESGVPVRNERFREILFEVANFPEATFTADVDLDEFSELAVGETTETLLFGKLTLKDTVAAIDADVIVTRIADNAVMVQPLKPIILDAAELDLGPALETLQTVAKLSSISTAVPVDFRFVFRQ